MLVLFETPAGLALFKLLDDGKLSDVDSLWKSFADAATANQSVKLKAFHKFLNTAEALGSATAIVEGKLSSEMKKFLRSEIDEKMRLNETLAVGDSKLGSAIAKKMGMKVVNDASVNELMRGIRSQLESLVTGLGESEMATMSLGLAHSLSRYKLKFTPDKVDTMIIQAIALLDDLDKELNTYSMRIKEWFGWHFPEMAKVISDNVAYAKTVLKMKGKRELCSATNFEDLLPEEIEKELKDVAEISMGTEISAEDILTVTHLCDQMLSMSEYRTQLFEYLKQRMNSIAPNLTSLVGELVGARLISHAGSLLNLAKHPASTVQILGAEKALFRALKAKKDTPKYGLIYHASLVGQAGQKLKGKMARMLAAKASLATRVDALTEHEQKSATVAESEVALSSPLTADLGIASRAKLEHQLNVMEGREMHTAAKDKSNHKQYKKYEPSVLLSQEKPSYNSSRDSTIQPTSVKKAKIEVVGEEVLEAMNVGTGEAESVSLDAETTSPAKPDAEIKKKKKKEKKFESLGSTDDDASQKKVSSKKKRKDEEAVAATSSKKSKIDAK